MPDVRGLFLAVVRQHDSTQHLEARLSHHELLVDVRATEAVLLDGKNTNVARLDEELHDAIDFVLVVVAADDFFVFGDVLNEKEWALEFDGQALAEFAGFAGSGRVIADQTSQRVDDNGGRPSFCNDVSNVADSGQGVDDSNLVEVGDFKAVTSKFHFSIGFFAGDIESLSVLSEAYLGDDLGG